MCLTIIRGLIRSCSVSNPSSKIHSIDKVTEDKIVFREWAAGRP
jgi:hypothetical protein